jgi:hypothetical protein
MTQPLSAVRPPAFAKPSASAMPTADKTAGKLPSDNEGSALVVPGDRPADVVAFERQVVGFFVDAADLLGVPKSVAAIYGIVFASPQPLSFADIEVRLDISKGSISQGLRVLREIGALLEVPASRAEPGEGRGQMAEGGSESAVGHPSSAVQIKSAVRSAVRYEPDLALRRLVDRFIEHRLQKQLNAGRNRLETLKATIPAGHAAEAKVLRQRVGTLDTWNKKARALLPMARTFLKITPI